MRYETGMKPEKEKAFFGNFFALCSIPFEEDYGLVLKQAGDVYERNSFLFARECITAFVNGFLKKEQVIHERGFLKELWQLLMEYYYPEDNDDYWTKTIADTCALGEKYASDFARKCVIALMEDLERKYKAGA